MLGIYINSHDLQDEKLINLVQAIPAGKCKIFFNTDVFAHWEHPTFHAQSLSIFNGKLICTCPFTYKFARKTFPNQENLYLMWRPEMAKIYRAADTAEALSEANVLGDVEPPFCKTFKPWNDFLKEQNV